MGGSKARPASELANADLQGPALKKERRGRPANEEHWGVGVPEPPFFCNLVEL